jgi:hypothetical protein
MLVQITYNPHSFCQEAAFAKIPSLWLSQYNAFSLLVRWPLSAQFVEEGVKVLLALAVFIHHNGYYRMVSRYSY